MNLVVKRVIFELLISIACSLMILHTFDGVVGIFKKRKIFKEKNAKIIEKNITFSFCLILGTFR